LAQNWGLGRTLILDFQICVGQWGKIFLRMGHAEGVSCGNLPVIAEE